MHSLDGICLCSHIWLDCNQFAIILVRIYTYQYCKSFTCGEKFDKKYRAAAKLISNHKLQSNCFVKKCISKHKCSSKLHPQKNAFQKIGPR